MVIQQPIDYSAIGKRIKKLRENVGLTQTQLGKKLKPNLSATAISLYETGDREVSIAVLNAMAEIFKSPVEYLIKGVDGAASINIALRADKDLSTNEKAVGQILDFIEFVKNRKKGGGNK